MQHILQKSGFMSLQSQPTLTACLEGLVTDMIDIMLLGIIVDGELFYMKEE